MCIESLHMAEAGSRVASVTALCGSTVVQFGSPRNVIQPFSVGRFSQDRRNICFLVPCSFNQRCFLCACGNYSPPSQGHQFSSGKCFCSRPGKSGENTTKNKERNLQMENVVIWFIIHSARPHSLFILLTVPALSGHASLCSSSGCQGDSAHLVWLHYVRCWKSASPPLSLGFYAVFFSVFVKMCPFM